MLRPVRPVVFLKNKTLAFFFKKTTGRTGRSTEQPSDPFRTATGTGSSQIKAANRNPEGFSDRWGTTLEPKWLQLAPLTPPPGRIPGWSFEAWEGRRVAFLAAMERSVRVAMTLEA